MFNKKQKKRNLREKERKIERIREKALLKRQKKEDKERERPRSLPLEPARVGSTCAMSKIDEQMIKQLLETTFLQQETSGAHFSRKILSKCSPRDLKAPPNAPQRGPGDSKSVPGAPQETPKTTPRALQEDPWSSKRPLGMVLGASGPHF